MRRNPFRLLRQEIESVAARAVRTAATETAPTSGASLAVEVGTFDATTGIWVPYGQLDITPLGEFRLAP